jgi:hypothetical protein
MEGVIGPILTAALSRHSPIMLELLSFLARPRRRASLRTATQPIAEHTARTSEETRLPLGLRAICPAPHLFRI